MFNVHTDCIGYCAKKNNLNTDKPRCVVCTDGYVTITGSKQIATTSDTDNLHFAGNTEVIKPLQQLQQKSQDASLLSLMLSTK